MEHKHFLDQRANGRVRTNISEWWVDRCVFPHIQRITTDKRLFFDFFCQFSLIEWTWCGRRHWYFHTTAVWSVNYLYGCPSSPYRLKLSNFFFFLCAIVALLRGIFLSSSSQVGNKCTPNAINVDYQVSLGISARSIRMISFNAIPSQTYKGINQVYILVLCQVWIQPGRVLYTAWKSDYWNYDECWHYDQRL